MDGGEVEAAEYKGVGWSVVCGSKGVVCGAFGGAEMSFDGVGRRSVFAVRKGAHCPTRANIEAWPLHFTLFSQPSGHTRMHE